MNIAEGKEAYHSGVGSWPQIVQRPVPMRRRAAAFFQEDEQCVLDYGF
jgi:hypothetical protein